MTDIVNDLRTALAERQKVMKGGGELYRRAADEIERLRDVNDQSTAALEAAERRAEEAERELQVAEDQANTIAGDLAQAELERDNWKMSAEEVERAEKRWKDRAVEAERNRDEFRNAWNAQGFEIIRLEDERDQLSAVMEKVRVRLTTDLDVNDESHVPDALDILAAAPANALRELKADVWDEGVNAEARAAVTASPRIKNPYRAREEQNHG